MKKQGDFQTQDPARLAEQLDRFQEAVDNETLDIRAKYLPQLSPRRFLSSTPVTDTLLLGQMGLCDSSVANVSVVLSAPADRRTGFLAIIKQSAANTVTLRPSGVNALGLSRRINAATSVAFGAGVVGLHWVYFDGTDWWV